MNQSIINSCAVLDDLSAMKNRIVDINGAVSQLRESLGFVMRDDGAGPDNPVSASVHVDDEMSPVRSCIHALNGDLANLFDRVREIQVRLDL